MERYPIAKPEEEPITDLDLDFDIPRVPEQLPKPVHEDAIGAHSFIELEHDDLAEAVESDLRANARKIYPPDIHKGDIPQSLIDADSGRYSKAELDSRKEKFGTFSRLYKKLFGKGGIWRS